MRRKRIMLINLVASCSVRLYNMSPVLASFSPVESLPVLIEQNRPTALHVVVEQVVPCQERPKCLT